MADIHEVSPAVLQRLATEQRLLIDGEWRNATGFTEIEMGFDEISAQEEAKRCLRCDLEWLEQIGEPIPQPE